MNLQELRNQLQSALYDLDVMEVLDPETSEFREYKKTASIAVKNAFTLFEPCDTNNWCEGCECNDTRDDKDPIGGGGTNPPE